MLSKTFFQLEFEKSYFPNPSLTLIALHLAHTRSTGVFSSFFRQQSRYSDENVRSEQPRQAESSRDRLKIICEDRLFDRAAMSPDVERKLARELVNNSQNRSSFGPAAFLVADKKKIQMEATVHPYIREFLSVADELILTRGSGGEIDYVILASPLLNCQK